MTIQAPLRLADVEPFDGWKVTDTLTVSPDEEDGFPLLCIAVGDKPGAALFARERVPLDAVLAAAWERAELLALAATAPIPGGQPDPGKSATTTVAAPPPLAYYTVLTADLGSGNSHLLELLRRAKCALSPDSTDRWRVTHSLTVSAHEDDGIPHICIAVDDQPAAPVFPNQRDRLDAVLRAAWKRAEQRADLANSTRQDPAEGALQPDP